MRLKEGVSLLGLRTETLLGMQVADSVYLDMTGQEMVVTSVSDGKHKRQSAHKTGRAFDCRTKGHPSPGIIRTEIAERLGKEFDVILEAVNEPNEHIHCEWDPK